MKPQPLDDRIVVLPDEPEHTTAFGLVIPDNAREKPQRGKVVAVGPGRWSDNGAHRIPLDVVVGDVVVYSKYGGADISVAGVDHLILTSRDILAKLVEE